MTNQSRTATFIAVKCSCGRELRAKQELAGTEIRCWDCHKQVLVPIPRQGSRVAQELSENALGVIKGPGLTSVLAAAVVVTALMNVPEFGLGCATFGLTLGGLVYGEMIRRIGRGPAEEPDPRWTAMLLPRSVPNVFLGALLAAGTVYPLWFRNWGEHDSPHWDRVGAAIAAATWTLIPLHFWIACASDGRGRLGAGRCLKILAKHPVAFLAAIAVVPATLILLELGLAMILYVSGNLPFFTLDYMPMPVMKSFALFMGIPYFEMIDYRSYPTSVFDRSYLRGLLRGYSFAGAIPASLSLPTRGGLSGGAIGLDEPLYRIARFVISAVVVTCLLTAFAIQARWLGAIPALEKRRPA